MKIVIKSFIVTANQIIVNYKTYSEVLYMIIKHTLDNALSQAEMTQV